MTGGRSFSESQRRQNPRFSPRKTVASSRPVKNPETPAPKPSSRSYVPRIVDPMAPLPEGEDKFLPRYVEVPALREHGFGRRNLAWGAGTLALALALLVAAVVLTGQKAVLSLAACLVTFAALFVLARLHVFRQRNGGFLAIALVVLLGALVALVDRGYEMLAGIATPAAPAALAAHPVETAPPLLTEAFALTKPDGTQPQVKVLKDSRVLIAEKPYIIRAGDVFPLLEAKAGEATFAVRDLHVSLPVAVVEILGGKPAKDAPKETVQTKESAMAAALAAVKAEAANAADAAKTEPASTLARPAADVPKTGATPPTDLVAITDSAKAEAIRRYPALSIKDSAENEVFVTTYRQLKDSGNTDFFANPEWPLELAELLATRNGWARGDRPAPAAPADPAPVLDAPSDLAPPMPPDTPAEKTTSRLPQQLPPPDDEPPQIPRAKKRR